MRLGSLELWWCDGVSILSSVFYLLFSLPFSLLFSLFGPPLMSAPGHQARRTGYRIFLHNCRNHFPSSVFYLDSHETIVMYAAVYIVGYHFIV